MLTADNADAADKGRPACRRLGLPAGAAQAGAGRRIAEGFREICVIRGQRIEKDRRSPRTFSGIAVRRPRPEVTETAVRARTPSAGRPLVIPLPPFACPNRPMACLRMTESGTAEAFATLDKTAMLHAEHQPADRSACAPLGCAFGRSPLPCSRNNATTQRDSSRCLSSFYPSSFYLCLGSVGLEVK